MPTHSFLESSGSTAPTTKIDSDNSSPISADNPPLLLQKALEKNDYVKEKIEECAAELSAINETMKKEIAPIAAAPQVKKALAQNEDVEDKVQQSALTLEELHTVLIEEIDDSRKLKQEFKQTKQELSATKEVLIHHAGCRNKRILSGRGSKAASIAGFRYRYSYPGAVQ